MPTNEPDTVKTALGLLRTQSDNLDTLLGAMNFQLLGNADQLVFQLCTSGEFTVETQDHIKRVVEEFLKGPVRRQVGRVKSMKAANQEVIRVLS
jgi:hypothetical protein